MKVLIAFEESQIETEQFIIAGHDAYSCDLKMSSGKYPNKHIIGDAYDVIYNNSWDLIIAHPPCTYLTSSSAVHLLNKQHEIINQERWEKALQAREKFIELCYNITCPHAIENPAPLGILNLPNYSQVIQPYYFGEPVSKRTCLWLYQLPLLQSTNIVKPEYSHTQRYRSSKARSTAFIGIAQAMASQWVI